MSEAEQPYPLRGLELIAGFPHGREAVPEPQPVEHPRLELERAVREALLRPPCLVAFSGGRDSSAVLALATHIARSEDLALPVPLVLEYPGDERAGEREWQDRVLAHLGLVAERVDGRAGRDLLGVEGQAALRRYGVVWPPVYHDKLALLALCRGGTLMTGDGGDEVLGPQRLTPLTVALRRGRRAGRRMWIAGARSISPAAIRAWEAARSFQPRPWLKPSVQAQVRDLVVADVRSTPLHWGRAVRAWRYTRSTTLGVHGFSVVCSNEGVRLCQPFLDVRVVDAIAGAFGPWGTNGRGDALQRLVGDLLPRSVIYRPGKATFNSVTFGPVTRAFLQAWDGTGLPADLVDAKALREEWQREVPSATTVALAQAAYLAAGVPSDG